MEKTVIPTVTELAIGTKYAAKQMAAKAGEWMPSHHANLESVLFIFEGKCLMKMDGEEIILKPGEAIVIPPMVKHQIKAVTDYKGIHFMPNDIKFEFFK